MIVDQDTEDRIHRMVVRFYELGGQDPELAQVFGAAITDWPDHFRIVADFWSNTLYGTGRYRGHPFPVHMGLDFSPAAFDAWLRAFTQACTEILTGPEALNAIDRARHMTESFRVGLFPFTAPDGTPSRVPVVKG